MAACNLDPTGTALFLYSLDYDRTWLAGLQRSRVAQVSNFWSVSVTISLEVSSSPCTGLGPTL